MRRRRPVTLAKITQVIVKPRTALLLALAALSFCQICFSQKWDPDRFGNHRAVLQVTASADAVRAHIPWRRRDNDPENKSLIVVDARTGKEISNVARIEINREFGDIAFEPVSGPGIYYVYYLPYVVSGRINYPKVTYPQPANQASSEWLARLKPDKIPSVEFVALESVDTFDAFSPMEFIATHSEVETLLARYPQQSYFVFPEDRSLPIRMAHDLPQVWIKKRTRSTI